MPQNIKLELCIDEKIEIFIDDDLELCIDRDFTTRIGKGFKIICKNELCRPFKCEGTDNDYKIFDDIDNRYGVYIFVDESGRALYAGEAHRQSLKERITQNYTEGDTGGTFRKNWCEKNKDFSKFKKELCKWRLVTISTCNKEKNWIHIFEKALIVFLAPEYNKPYPAIFTAKD